MLTMCFLQIASKTATIGVTGISPLASLPHFDVINGFAIDSMHAVFHGVFKDLLHRTIRILPATKVNELNSRIASIKVPQEVSRTVRPLNEFTRGNWRASELRTVAYLAPLLLRGLIPSLQYDSMVLFVTAMYFLHSAVVSADDLPKCQRQIQRFCRHLSTVYNDKSVYTYNLHLLLHLTDKVKQAGPLHTHSCDEFEMLFAKMLSVQHGSRGAPDQIMRYFSVRSALDKTSLQHSVSNNQLSELCGRITLKYYTKHIKFLDTNTSLLGQCFTKNLHRLSADCNSNANDSSYIAECYKKCVYFGNIYKVHSLCTNTVRVDCYLYLKRKFYLLLDIALYKKQVYFICNRISVNQVCSIHSNSQLELRYPLCKVHSVKPTLLSVKLTQRVAKCCTVKLDNELYLLPLPTGQHRS